MSIQPAGVSCPLSRMGSRTSRWSSVSAIAALCSGKAMPAASGSAVFGQRCTVLLPGTAGHDGQVDGQRSEQALGFLASPKGAACELLASRRAWEAMDSDHWVCGRCRCWA